MNAEELLWEHLTPMITLKNDKDGRAFPSGEVTYPRDCIQVQRCRPYRFTHKVVDKWFHDRTILVGDAAREWPLQKTSLSAYLSPCIKQRAYLKTSRLANIDSLKDVFPLSAAKGSQAVCATRSNWPGVYFSCNDYPTSTLPYATTF